MHSISKIQLIHSKIINLSGKIKIKSQKHNKIPVPVSRFIKPHFPYFCNNFFQVPVNPDMNYLTHFVVDHQKERPLYNFGLALPDLLNVSKRGWKPDHRSEEHTSELQSP